MKAHLIFKGASVVTALVLLLGSVAFAASNPFPDVLSLFRSKNVDPSIPESYRHSFKTSRNNVVMVFNGDHWQSLSNRAVNGPAHQQRTFCEALTRSDRSQGVIPSGFQYVPGGDGRVYLVKSISSPPAYEPVVVRKPTESRPSTRSREVVSRSKPKLPAVAATSGETVRRAIVTPVKQELPTAMPAADGSYRTAMGDVLMKQNGDQWEGYAPADVRQGLRAPDFCAKAAASDRLKGRLPADYTYVLLADDTLLAVRRESEIVRAAGIK
ncbi:MAG: hypothetical protein JNM99_03440 [Verrucomicrobiaceae bacterium]|nr:hypothetical protein [Verrucomicrobiaceae bacterium]